QAKGDGWNNLNKEGFIHTAITQSHKLILLPMVHRFARAFRYTFTGLESILNASSTVTKNPTTSKSEKVGTTSQ
ncbi:hypothetical protein, partial [Bacteroides heparinolyticus]|uniref:hypothetical protein n=1 Tax=Prevotella heparinolytica TaxID=28113 RepID=UPI0035A084C5